MKIRRGVKLWGGMLKDIAAILFYLLLYLLLGILLAALALMGRVEVIVKKGGKQR